MKEQLGPGSLVMRDLDTIWHPYTQMQTAAAPIAIVRGKDALLIAENGDEYLDAVSSWWVNIHGHGNDYIAKKIAQQAHQLEHCIFAGFTHPPAVELAGRVLEILPTNQSKIFYSDNGSTAVEVALKMALQYWHNLGKPKTKLLAFQHAYHGDTFGAMSVSGRSIFTRVFDDYLFEVDFIPIPVPDPMGAGIVNLPEQAVEVMADEDYFREIEEKLSEGSYAAFICEPLLLGSGGMLMYSPAALDKLMDICHRHQVLVIADEVMTGFGRTGKRFAMDYLHNKPDMMCLSKGLTGGTMALGITSCTQQIYDAFLSNDKLKTLFHGHSFTANPIACTAALASMDIFMNETCMNNVSRIAAQQAAFRKRITTHPVIRNVRQTGTIIAFEINTSQSDSYINNIRDFLYQYFLDRKIILRPLGNTLYVMPPYCTTDEQLHQVYDAIMALLIEREG